MNDEVLMELQPIEKAIREVYAARRPGAAPPSLRGRVARVPETVARPLIVPRQIAQLIAAAAVFLVAVTGILSLRLGAPGRAIGSSGPGGQGPLATFDPAIAGPGLGTSPDPGFLWSAVALVAALLLIAAWTFPGWRRITAGGGAVALIAWAAIGTFAPLSVGTTGWGPGVGLRAVDMPFGSSESIYDMVAGPGAPYALGELFITTGPLPVVIDGVDAVLEDPRQGPRTIGIRALWLDGEPNGGMTGPSVPFTPVSLSGNPRAIWMVWRSSSCALGPYSPTEPVDASKAGGWMTQTTIRLRLSVLGWPRVEDVPLGLSIVTPSRGNC